MANYLSKNTYFILRHGHSTKNLHGIIASVAEEAAENPPHLTDMGKKQAEEAAAKLATEGIDYIYASPYKRVMETASIVAEGLGLDIIKDERLREVDIGDWSGKTVEDYRRDFKGKDRLRYAVSNGAESSMDVRRRMEEFLDDIDNKHNNKNVIIVSHGDPIWMLESIILGVHGDKMLKIPYIQPGDFKRFGKGN